MIENILAAKTKVRILRFFFEFPLVKRGVREIALECRSGFGVTSSALKDLERTGIIKREKLGREIIYSLNKTSEYFNPLNEIFEIEKKNLGNLPFFYRNLLSEILISTKNYADLCLVFGSLITGGFTSKSDVDLFFVSDYEDKIRDICIKIGDRYGAKLQVIVINKNEMRTFRKSSLYKSIKKDSFILFGDENIIRDMEL